MADLDWAAANQRYLMAAVGVVRATLDRYVDRTHDTGTEASVHAVEADADAVATARADLGDAAASMPAPPALDIVCETFGLSSFERDVLVLCASVELHAAMGPLCATA